MKPLNLLFSSIIFAVALMLFCPTLFANQIGINFSEETIGVLGNYKKASDNVEFEADAQLQKSDQVSLATNASLQFSISERTGVKPFAAYSRNTVGNTLDVGAVINFSFGGLDIAGGASFRGADPAGAGLVTRFDANDNEVEVRPEGYTPNAYQLPAIDNINAVLHTGFDIWKIETELTGYVPITEHAAVPIILITRSQININFTDTLSANLAMDAKTYIHADGVAVEFKPIGGITYRF